MGLTYRSVGINAVDSGLTIKTLTSEDKIIAVAGNPNVGKSTLFNNLTGLNQHTGNWPGKTVTNAQGYCSTLSHSYVLVDIPGTYSLMAHSAEEEVARNFICFGNPDAVIVVCDATCLERNLNLVMQTLEITHRVIVCVNLMDEAQRKHIKIDLSKLSKLLGVPVIGTNARKKKSLDSLLRELDGLMNRTADMSATTDIKRINDNGILADINMNTDMSRFLDADTLTAAKILTITDVLTDSGIGVGSDKAVGIRIDEGVHKPIFHIEYDSVIEEAVAVLKPVLEHATEDSCNTALPATDLNKLNSRWLSLRLLDCDESLMNELNTYSNEDFLKNDSVSTALLKSQEILQTNEYTLDLLRDKIVGKIMNSAEEICRHTVSFEKQDYNEQDRKIDKFLTSKFTGYPVMILLLALIFWITVTGANYPSALLSDFLFGIEEKFTQLFHYLGAPAWLHGLVVLGIYRVLAWVVSVMLPPMAIFFPLFTLLEDVGYLPRIAYNLDHQFKKCCACGKQALTMCMGFGCNAAGIVGCRIIDSPRERLIAVITNTFVPCNGRFPTLIAIISMFFVGINSSISGSIVSALILTMLILFGIFMTFAMSRLLSKTILKGVPSSFTLELPPFRKPQVGKVIVRSIFDRTLFVLGRAAAIAVPAGMIIWLMANVNISGISLLSHCATFLDPFARLMGLDGIILMAFILGIPANEIVFPIIIMAYTAQGMIVEPDHLLSLKSILTENGWTWITAISTMLFSLMHWPCSTTLLTIKKETNSMRWTIVSFLIPTVTGIAVCIAFASAARLFL